MRLPTLLVMAVLIHSAVAAQAPASQPTADGVLLSYVRIAGIFGGRLVTAFDSIPAARYNYRPTPNQQSVGYIAQHVEAGNYMLCDGLSDLKHPRTAKDSLADTIKALWPKDTLVARLEASLRFCDAAIERSGPLRSSGPTTLLLEYETDLAEHYSQLSVYMRLLGMVPPSALPPAKHNAIDLPAAALAAYVGEYQLPLGAELIVTMRDGQLFIRSTPNGATVRLYPESENRFFVREADVQVKFARDANGAVAGLVFHQFGRDRSAPRLIH